MTKRTFTTPDATTAPTPAPERGICPDCNQHQHHHGTVRTYLNLSTLEPADCQCRCEGYVIYNVNQGYAINTQGNGLEPYTNYRHAADELEIVQLLFPNTRYMLQTVPL